MKNASTEKRSESRSFTGKQEQPGCKGKNQIQAQEMRAARVQTHTDIVDMNMQQVAPNDVRRYSSFHIHSNMDIE